MTETMTDAEALEAELDEALARIDALSAELAEWHEVRDILILAPFGDTEGRRSDEAYPNYLRRVFNDSAKMLNERDALRAHLAAAQSALRFGVGAAINELVARGLPTEWSPASGIGVMLRALGCNDCTLTDRVRALLDAPQADPARNQPVELTKEDALRESAYLDGLKRGWNFGIAEDQEGYQRDVDARAGYLKPLTQAAPLGDPRRKHLLKDALARQRNENADGTGRRETTDAIATGIACERVWVDEETQELRREPVDLYAAPEPATSAPDPEPKKRWEDTFSGETVVMKSFFPTPEQQRDEERAALQAEAQRVIAEHQERVRTGASDPVREAADGLMFALEVARVAIDAENAPATLIIIDRYLAAARAAGIGREE